MKVRPHRLCGIAAFALAGILGSAQSFAQNAYITNAESNNVSVIDTATNKVTATIPVGSGPVGVR
jgi:YVTN family beta-propeller protein